MEPVVHLQCNVDASNKNGYTCNGLEDFKPLQKLYSHFDMHSFQSNLANDSLLLITIAVLDMCISFGITYIICEIGQQITNAFEEIEDVIGQIDWYLFPIEFKRMFPMFVNAAQQPMEIACFGSVPCSRGTYKKVCY